MTLEEWQHQTFCLAFLFLNRTQGRQNIVRSSEETWSHLRHSPPFFCVSFLANCTHKKQHWSKPQLGKDLVEATKKIGHIFEWCFFLVVFERNDTRKNGSTTALAGA